MRESYRPFEESSLWDLLASFYVERGLESWTSGTVPNRVSSNAWMAEAYADIIAALLRDLEAAGSKARPLVLELGAGSGLFAWHWTRRLAEVWPGDGLPVDALVTETSPALVRAWLDDPRMARWFARPEIHLGTVTVGDAAPEEVVDLDGVTVPLRDRPLVLLANYVIDGIPTDMLHLRDGRMHRVHVALEGEVQERTSGRPDFSALEVSTEDRLLPPDGPVTGHDTIDREIEAYLRRGVSGYVPVPMRAIRFLERLGAQADPLLLLSGDLAITTDRVPDELPLVHHAYVACRTNFHLLGRAVESRGGSATFARTDDSDFVVGAFAQSRDVPLARCEEAARARLLGFAPPDVLNLDELLLAHPGTIDSWTVMGWLRMAAFDPVSVQGAIPHLDRSLDADKPLDRSALQTALVTAVRHDLPAATGTDALATKAAMLLLRAGLVHAIPDVLDEVARDGELSAIQLHLQAVADVRLGRPGPAGARLDELTYAAPTYWNGWPERPPPSTAAALASAPDERHLDHMMLQLSVANLMGDEGR